MAVLLQMNIQRRSVVLKLGDFEKIVLQTEIDYFRGIGWRTSIYTVVIRPFEVFSFQLSHSLAKYPFVNSPTYANREVLGEVMV